MRHHGQLKPELRWASSSSYGAVRARVSSVGPRLRVNLSIPASVRLRTVTGISAGSQCHLGRRKIITSNTEGFHAHWKEGICQIGCSAEFYAGWDSMISTSSGNHSALAGEVSRQLNAAGAG